MHYAVANSVDFIIALYASQFRIRQNVEHGFYGAFVVDHAEFADGLGAVVEFIFQEAVGQSDFLHAAFSHYVVGSGVNEFVFYGTAAAIQNEYFHFLWI